MGTPHSFAGDGAHHKWRKQYLHGDTYKQRSQAAVPEVRWKLGDYTVSYGAQRDAPAESLERVHEGPPQVCVAAQRDVRAEAREGDEVGEDSARHSGVGVMWESCGVAGKSRSGRPARRNIRLNSREDQVEPQAGDLEAVSVRTSSAVEGWEDGN